MLYEEKVTENRAAFLSAVENICGQLDIEPDWLMAVMNSESGLNHRAVNPNGGATGLIQFMPATAIFLGATTAALKAMSNVEQLEYVRKYLYPYRYKIKSYADLYMSIFFPAALGKTESWIIRASGLPAEKVASANRIFDLDSNGILTVSEVREAFLRRVPESLRNRFRNQVKKK
ncbi:MAG: transglycosylase SLT domain-containing protein [Bacteroidales bacterium]|jgi:hypothetical protein|nr:transglycosylase SLT domain-containing protein [Bacteroidales bacterium]